MKGDRRPVWHIGLAFDAEPGPSRLSRRGNATPLGLPLNDACRPLRALLQHVGQLMREPPPSPFACNIGTGAQDNVVAKRIGARRHRPRRRVGLRSFVEPHLT